MMKINLSIIAISLAFFLNSCIVTKYAYMMESPIKSNSLIFENDSIKFILYLTESNVQSIQIDVFNKLNTPVKIIWDDASISLNGYTEKILHKHVNFTDRNKSMPPTNIPPNEGLNDILAPSNMVKFRRLYSCLTQKLCVYL